MAVKLGHSPNKADFIFSIAADWVCNFTEKDTVWPDGTEVWLEIGEDSWSAVVTEAAGRASFIIQSDDLDPIEEGSVCRIYRRFPTSPTTEQLWFVGPVKRRDDR